MNASPRAATDWLRTPAVEGCALPQARAQAGLRILLGLMWLYNVSWKRPPDFGRDHGSGLFKYTSDAVSHPVLAPYSWVVQHAVLPHFLIFGWLVLLVESALAVLLLTGTWVRAAAALGALQSLAIGLSVAHSPGEWPWSYLLMVGGHVVLLFSSAGLVLGTDSVRARLNTGRLLARTWGVLGVVVGLVAVLGSLGDPLASSGYNVSYFDLSVSLGTYNLLGGLALALAGALLLLATRSAAATDGRTGLAAAVLATLAAISLYAQVGFSDPILGGSATSAAFFLSLAVVAVFAARARPGSSAAPRSRANAGAV